MGRKIPGRKHRGVIDPVKQKKQRDEKLKKVINAPPTSLDQPIPKSMVEFVRLKEIGKRSQFNRSGKKKRKAPDGAFVHQKSAEDKGKNRGNQKPNVLSKKNQVQDSGQNHERRHQGEHMDNFDDEIIDKNLGKLKWKDGTEKRKKATPGAEPKKKVDRRIEKRKKLLEKRRAKMEEKVQLLQKDNVAFGEVAHEPPSMRIKPKYASANERQMGLKDLHLTRLLNRGTVAPVTMVSATTSAKPKVRLRDLPAKERDAAERKQQAAVLAYRLIKSKRSSASNQQ